MRVPLGSSLLSNVYAIPLDVLTDSSALTVSGTVGMMGVGVCELILISTAGTGVGADVLLTTPGIVVNVAKAVCASGAEPRSGTCCSGEMVVFGIEMLGQYRRVVRELTASAAILQLNRNVIAKAQMSTYFVATLV